MVRVARRGPVPDIDVGHCARWLQPISNLVANLSAPVVDLIDESIAQLVDKLPGANRS